MNVTEVTTAAGWIIGLAIVALVASGWRKPARAAAVPARARRTSDRLRPRDELGVDTVQAPLAAPTPVWKRVRAVVASSVLAVWIGAVVATIVGFGVAIAVITLTHMLKR